MSIDKNPVIVIADDDPTNLKILAQIISEDNYEIVLLTNGYEVINFVNHEIPDLILLDVMMPELDGYETCKILKSSETTKNIPVVFVTALNDAMNEKEGLKIGGIDYIIKPINSDIVKQRVRNYLNLNMYSKELMHQNKVLIDKEEKHKITIDEKDKIISIIAHDLKNPFTSLMGISEMVKMRFEKMSHDDILKSINEIYNSGKQIYSLLENLLEWSKMSGYLTNLNTEEFDLNEIINNSILLYKESAENKNIIIENNSTPTNIINDKRIYFTIIRNLLNNAIKLSNKNGKIIFTTYIKNDILNFEIVDNGIGMTPEQIKKIETNALETTKGTSGEKELVLVLI